MAAAVLPPRQHISCFPQTPAALGDPTWLRPSPCDVTTHASAPSPRNRSNEYIAELGKLEAAKGDMIGGGQPVELAVELLRWAGPQARMVCGCGWAVGIADLVTGSAA